MKKLISLIFVALISSQMWAATLTFSTNNGTISATKGTSSVTSVTSGSSLSTWYDYTITVSSPTWDFEKWTVTYGSTTVDVTTSAVTNTRTFTPSTSGTSRILKFSTNGSPSNITIVAHFIDPSTVPSGPVAPTAGAKASYTATPGTNAMQLGPNVEIPNFSNAVDLGFAVLWAKKDVGSAGVGYRGTKYTYSAAMALSAATLGGTGWRIPTYNELASGGLGGLSTKKDGNDVVFTRSTGYYGVEFIVACESAGATDLWSGPSSGSTNYYGRATKSSGSWTFPNGTSTASYEAWVRPVFDLAAAGIKKLTINVVKDGHTYTNNYYVANNQQVDITPATVSGYNSSWTSGVSGTGTKTFTVTANTTATITYTEAITYVTATFKQADGTTNYCEPQQVESGKKPTKPEGTPAKDPTNTIVYTFNEWNTAADGSGDNLNVAITANTTYYPVFTESTRHYTVRFLNYDNSELKVIDDAEYNSSVIFDAEDPVKPSTDTKTYTFNGWSPAVAAVTGDQDYVAQFTENNRTYTIRFVDYDGREIQVSQEEYNATTNVIAPADPEREGYEFDGWTPDLGPVTSDQTYTATYIVPSYTLTIGACTNGYVTLTANGTTKTVPAAGGSYSYEEGTNITVNAVNNRYFHFVKWTEDNNEAARRMIREIDEDMTLTPTFADNTAFPMLDTWTEAECSSNYNKTNYLTVTLDGRTFNAGEWSTISLPFDLRMTPDDDLYGAIYAFAKADLGVSGNSVTIEFNRTYEVKANVPYLVVPTVGVTNPEFDCVRLVDPVETTLSSDGKVNFTSSLWQQTLYGPTDFYVGTHNTLRYARNTTKGGTIMKGNRAFFRKIGGTSAPMRVRARIDGVDQEIEITEDGDIQPVENTRKYMENGILVIERNGVKYDAQGKAL